ncbi:MAG: ATP-binding protein [Alphaproteobacteria bacterium]|nr:ATP-binding protein [Alphaproteobacteria bacterium]
MPKNAPESDNFLLSRTGDGDRLPAVVGFYGANASGKTTVLRAIGALARFGANSFFAYAPEAAIPDFLPFLQLDSWAKPSKISVEFDADWMVPESELSEEAIAEAEKTGNLSKSHWFRYDLHIGHEPGKKMADHVVYEALHWFPQGRPRMLFERTGQDIKFSKEMDVRAGDPKIASIRPNSSVISTLAQLNHPLMLKIRKDLITVQSNIAIPITHEDILKFYHINPLALERLNDQLRRIDFGLRQMVIEASSNGLRARFTHEGLDHDIFWNEESAGTKSFVGVFPLVFFALETGSIATIDELECNLHPKLVYEIVQWFYDKNTNKHQAQLLFTAHNTSFLQDLEKEQVFFTEKYANGETKIYGAKDIQGLRREPDLAKKYMAGVLGAIPNIG